MGPGMGMRNSRWSGALGTGRKEQGVSIVSGQASGGAEPSVLQEQCGETQRSRVPVGRHVSFLVGSTQPQEASRVNCDVPPKRTILGFVYLIGRCVCDQLCLFQLYSFPIPVTGRILSPEGGSPETFRTTGPSLTLDVMLEPPLLCPAHLGPFTQLSRAASGLHVPLHAPSCLLSVPLCIAVRFLLGWACLPAREEAGSVSTC